MQIHVVQSGQSLWGISRAFGVTVDQVASANQIDPNLPLVVGQTLVIPITGRYHWVQPGDTLWRIANRYGVSVQAVAAANQIRPEIPLQVGTRLYIPPRTKRPAETNAYVEPRGEAVAPNLLAASREAVPYLTYLAPFSYQVQRDGSLVGPPLGELPAIAREAGATLMMVITNLEEDAFSAELGRIILNDMAVQDRMMANIMQVAREVDYRDIHFDFEFLRPEDRDAYNRFLRKAAQQIRADGRLISTALAPKTRADQPGAWYEAHDYRAHGEIVDFVVIMTYEWGWSGGPPMAVSPLPQVRQVLEYALTEMPGQKIMMGQNLYGYDWTLPYEPGGPFARAISPQTAIALARDNNAAIRYDAQSQAPTFTYVDAEGREHEVWFEDARSIQAKFDLIKELGLRGISYWKLGLPFPQNWLLLQDNFEIVKK